jgi:hypothetical protein
MNRAPTGIVALRDEEFRDHVIYLDSPHARGMTYTGVMNRAPTRCHNPGISNVEQGIMNIEVYSLLQNSEFDLPAHAY